MNYHIALALVIMLFCDASIKMAFPSCSYSQLPGKWSLNKNNHRDTYVPDEAWKNGFLFVSGVSIKKSLVLSLEVAEYFLCHLKDEQLITIGSEKNFNEEKGYKYKCDHTYKEEKFPALVFFDSQDLPESAEFYFWDENMKAKPPEWFNSKENGLIYFEKKTQSKIFDGTIFLSAWIEGYPPKKEFNKEYGEEIITDKPRIKYLSISVQKKDTTEVLVNTLKDKKGADSLDSSFVASFLPAAASSLDQSKIKGAYKFKNEIWLRVDSSQSIEGSGSEDGLSIIAFKDKNWVTKHSCSRTRMY